MKPRLLYLLFLLFLLGGRWAGAQVPHLTGTVDLSVTAGTLRADLYLSGLPRLNNYRVWLNTGLNVEYFRDSAQRRNLEFERRYAPDTTDEAWQYVFSAPNAQHQAVTQSLPESFRIRYTGAFPVYRDTARAYDRNDWKGNIACNGRTLRATEQSAWYPVIYDRAQDRQLANYTYDLTIRCVDCQTIYVNGSAPVAGPTARVSSRTAAPLLLFAGQYAAQRFGNTYFINSQLTPAQAEVFGQWLGRTRRFYEQKLGLPYGSNVVFLNSTPISKSNGWMFVTYPTIASIGWGQDFSALFRQNVLADSTLLPFFTHELGHYYFGTYFKSNATLEWALLEGTTEYLALKATQAVLGPKAYRKQLAYYRRQIDKHGPFVPLPAVQASKEIDNAYRYAYFPTLLLALEKQVGEKRVYRWLSTVLRSHPAATDYAFFRQSLLDSGLKPRELAEFEARYITATDARASLLALLP